MPVFELTSAKTGQNYRADFDQPPSEADVDEAVSYFDNEAARAAGVDPEVLNQGPLGTFARGVPQELAKVGTGAIQGAADIIDKTSQSGLFSGGPLGFLSAAMRPAAQQAAGVAADLEDAADAAYPTNPFNAKAQTVASGFGQGAKLVAGGAIGKAAGLGDAALVELALVSGGLSGVHEGVTKAEDIGVESPEAQIAMGLLFGTVEAGTEKMFGFGNKGATEALLNQFKQPAAALLKQAAKSIGGEAVEEIAAGSAQDLLTRAFADEDPANPGFTRTGVELPKLDRKMLERRGLEALGGAAGGTVFAGAQTLANAAAAPAPQPVPEQPLSRVFTRRDGSTTTLAFDKEPTPQDLAEAQAWLDQQPGTTNQEQGTVPNDNLPPSQTTPTPQPPAPAGAAAPLGANPAAPAASPLIGIAERAGAVDVDPLLPESTGDLTAEDVADLEPEVSSSRFQVPRPILQGMPDRAAPFRDNPFAAAQEETGNLITDLRIPRSPQAIAQSQQQEQDRLAQQAKLRNTEAKTGRGPVLPESTGDLTAEDVQDLETQNLPLSSSSETLPTVANPDPAQTITGSNVQTGTEMPVPPPTADAGAGAGAPGVVNQSQSSYLDRVLDAAIQDESMGELTIPVPEKNQNRDDLDKAVAVIEARGLNAASDGKSILVRGFRELRRAAPPPSNPVSPSPSPQVPARNASRSDAGRSPSESSSPTGFTHTTLSRDLEAGFMTTAGADALLDLAHSAFRAGQTFVQWSKSMLQRFGESIRQWLAGAWDHAKRSSQTGAVNFTGRLGSDLQKAASKAKASGPATSNQQPASSLQPAYMAAMQGRSSAMVPIKDVYAQAKAQNPNLTPEQFLAEVQAGDNAGTVLLEPFDTPQGLQAAGPFVVRNGSGVPSINMLVQRGFTHLDVSGQASQRGAVQFDSRTVDETRSRFASPREEDRQYETRADEAVLAEAEQYLDSVSVEAAVDAFVNGTVPLSGDAMVRAASRLLLRLNTATTAGTEVQRMWAHVQSQRMGRAWTSRVMSQDPARMLRQRAVANTDLISIAPILAAQEVLIDRADAVMDKRFDGGAEGAVEKVKEVIKKVDEQAGTEVAADLEAETEGSENSPVRKPPSTRKGAVRSKHPNLKKLLDALRKKLYPGMKWADIFMELPSTQKDRQIEIYRRLKLDERLQSLTPEDRLALTNELDKAWQRERRKVFNRELKKAGVIGEKDASDRAKVEKALPKLLRMINLGMFNSEMWREAVAPEYGLKMLTSADTLQLRTLAEAAWKLPEGVLRNQKLRDLLNGIQKKTGASWIEVLNSYWTAAVLSGLRTQFDTWLAAVNGMGTNLMQIGGLIARGRGKAAIDAHAQWWRGLIEGVRESGQILFKGDTSYLKRFGADLMKALEGETSVTPVPMGENLWRSPDAKTAAGRAFQKYGLAPVMMFTGRLMAAADHINNTATTQGAIAVARALHPELYQGRVGFTEAERANARTQALREVTGGREPQTAQERATLSARVRELLNGSVSKQDYADSSEIGDMAAFQNDPTGVFGIVYSAMKQGLGSIQRGLGNYAEDVTANRFARVASGIMAGSLHGITGTRFMRFGANFGAEMTRYIPGSYYVLGKAGFYGRNVSRMQQELLLGKNLVGLMIGSTLAAVFLAGDDDDEGWQIEGDWSTLTPQEAKARMAAGYERMTMWKRDGDKIRRISYKQWPTMGLFSVVGGMLDEKRHKPAQWAAHGTSGHLLRGLATGYVQVKNVSAVRNLVELFGDPAFSADGVTGAIDKFVKTSSNFAGGLMPTLVKDADIWSDPRNFKPEGVAEQFLRSVPFARKFINDGRPQLNLLGEEVKLQRSPWSRAYTSVESAEAHRVLGALMARGLSLPMPSDQIHVFKDGIKVPLETLGREAVWKYEKAVGQAYKEWLNLEGSDLLKLPVKQADAVIKRRAEAIKSRAKAAVTR